MAGDGGGFSTAVLADDSPRPAAINGGAIVAKEFPEFTPHLLPTRFQFAFVEDITVQRQLKVERERLLREQEIILGSPTSGASP